MTFQCIEERLSPEQKKSLDKMLDIGPSKGSVLGWLRRVPRSCTAAGILDLLQRIGWARERSIPASVAENLSWATLRQLAGRGARHTYRISAGSRKASATPSWPPLSSRCQGLTGRVIDFIIGSRPDFIRRRQHG
jgi:hypothetical protein